jgi:hypothetical protein
VLDSLDHKVIIEEVHEGKHVKAGERQEVVDRAFSKELPACAALIIYSSSEYLIRSSVHSATITRSHFYYAMANFEIIALSSRFGSKGEQLPSGAKRTKSSSLIARTQEALIS